MPRKFIVPELFSSALIKAIKQKSATEEPRRKEFSPTLIDFGPVVFKLARYFGFCFGVENAIEIAYRALEENKDKRIFLLSEMIHNHDVNADLIRRGVRFLTDPQGCWLVPLSELNSNDIVIVPAFGTTLEVQQKLAKSNINFFSYDATCPFVEKVWKRAEELGRRGFTVVVHGKRVHEETRATVSHSQVLSPTIVILDLEEAEIVAGFMRGNVTKEEFFKKFQASLSDGFDPQKDLRKIGIVNQTTMLAAQTKAIAALFKQTMVDLYGEGKLKDHFADTCDTLCYATNKNQEAVKALVASGLDLSIIVGGYNSSNTTHLVELSSKSYPTFYIKDEREIISKDLIRHFSLESKDVVTTTNWLVANEDKDKVIIGITSGASCPDAAIEGVIGKVITFFPGAKSIAEVSEELGLDLLSGN